MTRLLPPIPGGDLLATKLDAAATEVRAVGIARRAGLIGGESPRGLVTTFVDMSRLGAPAAALQKAARRDPDRASVIDELGVMSYRELDEAANAVANHWRSLGFEAGDGVAILARNHRWFVVAFFAASKLGARILMLNTDFAGPQVREVASREGTDLLVHDEEYGQFLDGVDPRFGRFLAWSDSDGKDTLASVAAGGNTARPPAPATHAKIVVLTSGTTGTPKGAPRAEPRGITPVAALLERAPFRHGDRVENCAPMFHSLGLAFMLLTVALAGTLIVRRRFDPDVVLGSIESNQSRGMVMVPVMLARLLDALDHAKVKPDLDSLEVVLLGGSQLGGELAERGLEGLGPVIHNLYGSTEVAYATIATPEDLAASPATVGRPVLGTKVRILDESGREARQGEVGRIFVRNSLPFDGYTGGGTKEVIDGCMSTGDVGHFDENGRLFVDGRDDEMIVSGGENVFPREIEELLEHVEGVVEVAVIGVPDDKWGQRLRAFVVCEDGAKLTAEGLQDHVREHLARFKVPRDVVFIDTLPRNATGKILKRVLKDLE
ncbi:MAG: AMP-binding protein [Aeromicrobium sp.]